MSGPIFSQSFDPSRGKRYLNLDPSLIHGRDSVAFFTRSLIRLSRDARRVGTIDPLAPGPHLLAQAMEDASYLALKRIFLTGTGEDAALRKAAAEELFSRMGLGTLSLLAVGLEGGRAEMGSSAVDEGWIATWGRAAEAVNHVGRGFVAGAFSAVTGRGIRAFAVEETKSIARGDPISEFTVSPRVGAHGG